MDAMPVHIDVNSRSSTRGPDNALVGDRPDFSGSSIPKLSSISLGSIPESYLSSVSGKAVAPVLRAVVVHQLIRQGFSPDKADSMQRWGGSAKPVLPLGQLVSDVDQRAEATAIRQQEIAQAFLVQQAIEEIMQQIRQQQDTWDRARHEADLERWRSR